MIYETEMGRLIEMRDLLNSIIKDFESVKKESKESSNKENIVEAARNRANETLLNHGKEDFDLKWDLETERKAHREKTGQVI